MPRSSRSPLHAFDSLDEIAAALRANGGRFSVTRRRVLEALFAADGAVSADHIARGLDGRTRRLDLTSVYRSLERLEELGVVRHVHIGHGPGLYALAGSGEREYLVCERCHEVTSVDAARLDSTRAEIRDATGYEACFSHFPIVGLCPGCRIAIDREPDPRLDLARPTRGGKMTHDDEHSHDKPHTHEHSHGDVVHAHPHTEHEHEHVEHDHEHSHDDRLHAHPHVHEEELLDKHEHEH